MLSVVAAVLVALQADPAALAGRIAQKFSDPDRVDPADESAARNSSASGPRFAALLLDVHRCAERGRGAEKLHRALIQFSGGPSAMSDVVRSLAASLKKAAYCGDCKDGRVPCADCKGKGKIEFLKCKVCSGEGRYRPTGAVGATDLTVKCRNCDGHGGFRNVGCAACSKVGNRPCPACLGRPWFDRECPVADCKASRVPCESCRGRGRIDLTCPSCEGKGRTRASGATPNADVTVKCRGCEGKGKLEEPAPCPACDATGRVPCKTCRGDSPPGPQRRVALSALLTLSPCGDCAGTGGACAACFGLGVKVRAAE